MDAYYQDNHVTIYHCDCKILLPRLNCDLIVTDPPYGIKEAAGKNKSRGGKDYGNKNWDDKPPPLWIFELMREISKYQIIFGGNFFPLPPSSCWLVWDKDNGNTDFADCELAWTNLKKAVRKKKYRWCGRLQEPGRKKETRCHPTQKPLEVMKWAISHAPDNCELIIDPFMGVGTTLRAAKDLGKKAIGIEQDEEYCEYAAKRMAQEILFER